MENFVQHATTRHQYRNFYTGERSSTEQERSDLPKMIPVPNVVRRMLESERREENVGSELYSVVNKNMFFFVDCNPELYTEDSNGKNVASDG